MSWRLLSAEMQRAVFSFGWTRLWPLQDQAIGAILGGQEHVLIAGDTAAGKTEAAFLPILSLPPAASGFSVLYCSPLRALLNDQFGRVGALAAHGGVPVHLWHADVPGARKQRTREQPAGILLTTPESLEALCLYRAAHLPLFFGQLRFIVIDELHVFLGTGRGAQLHSLLRRLDRYSAVPARRIGLSATIGDRIAAAAFLGEPCTICAGAGPRKGLRLHLRYAPGEDVLPDVLAVTRGRKALIFCNSRARVEDATYHLNRMLGRDGVYLAHHGSLHARERRQAESALRTAAAGSIVCTSTLELGIDIGAVDLVVQVDATHSVTGLRQRLGRSGRGVMESRTAQLYATGEPGLVQTVAVVELMRRGWVEPPEPAGPHWDVLWQQVLSTAAERGLTEAELAGLPAPLVAHMVAADHLARSGALWIPGLAGERLAHRRDFLAVFRQEQEYEVAHGSRVLGRVPRLSLYRPGTPLILGGRPWTIEEVQAARGRLVVVPGAVAQAPVFTSQAVPVHDRVRQEMVAVLLGEDVYPYLDRAGQQTLSELRRHFRQLGLSRRHRPVLLGPGGSEWLAFAGDRVANTLALILQSESGLIWEVTEWGGLRTPQPWPPLQARLARYAGGAVAGPGLAQHLLAQIPDDALLLPKFGQHLPPLLQRELHAATVLDVAGALRLLAAAWPHGSGGIDAPFANLRHHP